MMLIRYITQIGRYCLMLREIFIKQTKWSVMKKLIFKEIDDLIIDSLGIVAFISFFVGSDSNSTKPYQSLNPQVPYWFCHTTISNTGVCSYIYLCDYGRKNGFLHHFEYRYHACYRANRRTRSYGC